MTYTASLDSAIEWLRRHAARSRAERSNLGKCLLGLDVEWRPTFAKGEQAVLGTLQIATAKHVLVLQLSHLDCAPKIGGGELWHIISSADVVGMSIDDDVNKLRTKFEATTLPQAIELKSFAVDRDVHASNGLVGLMQHLDADIPSWKTRKLQMSNWTLAPLSDNQLRYAAMDAWASLQCYLELVKLPPPPPPPPPATRYSLAEFCTRLFERYGEGWVSLSRIGQDVPLSRRPLNGSLKQTLTEAGLDVDDDNTVYMRWVDSRVIECRVRFEQYFNRGEWINAAEVGSSFPRSSRPDGCNRMQGFASKLRLEVSWSGTTMLLRMP